MAITIIWLSCIFFSAVAATGSAFFGWTGDWLILIYPAAMAICFLFLIGAPTICDTLRLPQILGKLFGTVF